MSLINLEELLRPVSDAAPSGENLEYDPGFMILERASQGKPEQRMGSSVVPGEPPDWRIVLDQSLALLQRTKDLRVAVHAVHALLNRGGLEGIHDGLALARGLLEGFWPTVHPQLDPEDGDDPTMRITALAALSTPSVLATLRAAPLLHSTALGSATLKMIQAAGPVGSSSPESATLEGIFQGADRAALIATGTWLKQSAAHLAAIDATFEERTGSRGPDLSALAQSFREGVQAVAPRVDALLALERVDTEGDGVGAPMSAAGAPRAGSLTGDIGSREDVLRALDKLCAYYARYEPSSPLPILLQRCKRLVPMNFVDIVRELAPDGLGQVEVIAGKTGD